MMLTKEQRETFEEAARPLIKWLCENANPHASVEVRLESAELREGVCKIVVEDYIKD